MRPRSPREVAAVVAVAVVVVLVCERFVSKRAGTEKFRSLKTYES